ncbi:SET domain-containing protein [Coniochaeta ligniaria NRRL 30616]|uniref:SET domain-containing protein n=1 Tax=Coniochaeta ligniaria NRRL 30616 TaxID=1408157 RepID=A0A1J7JIV2_9PEZI|nr:SET domain-containing protein [Coniochaeta ligniaria NRRL 30616]
MDHPYRHLELPCGAPFELKPSPGKGWGGFATRLIKRGEVILSEKPLFVIRKPWFLMEEDDVPASVRQLSPKQREQFKLLRNNASAHFPDMGLAFAQNNFYFTGPSHLGGAGDTCGCFLLMSRFNHSCLPNAAVPNSGGQGDKNGLVCCATKDIAAGEEITYCYNPEFEGKTRLERREALGFQFVCDCKACHLGTAFQRASDMRRRLIRGLMYLCDGEEINGSRTKWLITDSRMREAAENLDTTISSRFIYTHLIAFFLEEEGLLNEVQHAKLFAGMPLAAFFATESNVVIARLTVAQNTWWKKLCVACYLWGRGDAADLQLTAGLRKRRDWGIRSK